MSDENGKRETLCLQPMTHGDARFAEGRKAGLREAWGMMCDAVDALPVGHASRGIVADALLGVSVKLSELAGEP